MSEEEDMDNIKTICRDILNFAQDKDYDKENFFTALVMLINLRKSQDSEEEVERLESMEKHMRSEMRTRE